MLVNITTPALLFPAISLLLLAYTNRFLALATLIRSLKKAYKDDPKRDILGQIQNLRQRLNLIKNMQVFGIVSFFLCVTSMFLIFWENPLVGSYLFGASLVALGVSLGISLRELQISTRALNLELGDMELKKD